MKMWGNIWGFCGVPQVSCVHGSTGWPCGSYDGPEDAGHSIHSLAAALMYLTDPWGQGTWHVPGSGLLQSCAHFWGPRRQILGNQTLPPVNLLGESCGWHYSWSVHRSFSPAKQLSFILLYRNMWFRDDSSLLFEPGLCYYLVFQPNIIRNVDVPAQGHFLQN